MYEKNIPIVLSDRNIKITLKRAWASTPWYRKFSLLGGLFASLFDKSEISEEGMVNVKLMAKTMKANPTTKYKVAGFADKGTGSVEGNQILSEKRAQAVYDALIAEGISADRLEKVAMGGTDPMFEKGYLNRVVILEVQK